MEIPISLNFYRELGGSFSKDRIQFFLTVSITDLETNKNTPRSSAWREKRVGEVSRKS